MIWGVQKVGLKFDSIVTCPKVDLVHKCHITQFFICQAADRYMALYHFSLSLPFVCLIDT